MKAYLKEAGMRHQTSVSYTTEQNGIAERANRILEKARCLLQDGQLDQRFWEEAIRTAIYLKNPYPTRTVKGKTPYKVGQARKLIYHISKH